ncbi:hypothetical protein TELCIR_14836 [Teladorsagia circumcincta]|uniref:RRM domain-containing protein n=1 Tax=Teladorsagia circumcincta TaxID=45464 RepID=A0A2G9TZV8_TELCI|nr:hypothetical protein TELCIR_14836 [Teladorsagia circumcincta]
MVKLFVGNLADTVDSTKLKQVFQQFTKVTECDVVKNYAFVHIEDDDVQSIINRLNGYTLEGKNIHIQLSTSKLRSQPGMSNQCFRCASTDHKTPNCPKDPNNQVTQTIKIDLTGAVKRPAGAIDGPDAKRPVQMISMVDEEIPRPPEPLSSAAVPYIAPQPQAYTQPTAIGGNHPYSLKAPYAAATPPQVQQVATVPQIGAVPGQQPTYIPGQPTAVYGTVGATMQQGLAVQQQQPTIGVQSSAPMTTQQYLQSVGLQQAQQQQAGAQLGLGQVQQTTLNAPYAGVSAGTSWMQQQQQQPAVQQQMIGQYQRQPSFQQSPQRQSSMVPQQQQSYQTGGLVKLNIM